MPMLCDYENHELIDCFELGASRCPMCNSPVIGHFKDGELIGAEPCPLCGFEDRTG